MQVSERGLALLAKRYGRSVSPASFTTLEQLVDSEVRVELNRNEFGRPGLLGPRHQDPGLQALDPAAGAERRQPVGRALSAQALGP